METQYPRETIIWRNYTVKLFLPLALLRFNTCLPVFDAMRTRNPSDLFLLVFDLFVKVFFMFKPLKVIRWCVNHSRIYLSRLNWWLGRHLTWKVLPKWSRINEYDFRRNHIPRGEWAKWSPRQGSSLSLMLHNKFVKKYFSNRLINLAQVLKDWFLWNLFSFLLSRAHPYMSAQVYNDVFLCSTASQRLWWLFVLTVLSSKNL